MWKAIPNTNNGYSANSETGDIKGNDRFGSDGRKIKGKILKQNIQNNGYCYVDLMVNGKKLRKLVHRLIAETFLDNYSDTLDVNHKDCNKTNNKLENLECVTRKENLEHAKKNGLIIASEKQIQARNNIKNISKTLLSNPIAMYTLNDEFVEEFSSMEDVHRKYGFEPASIRRCANGQYKQSYGYKWKFK
jgi:HNH endonuclease domain protein